MGTTVASATLRTGFAVTVPGVGISGTATSSTTRTCAGSASGTVSTATIPTSGTVDTVATRISGTVATPVDRTSGTVATPPPRTSGTVATPVDRTSGTVATCGAIARAPVGALPPCTSGTVATPGAVMDVARYCIVQSARGVVCGGDTVAGTMFWFNRRGGTSSTMSFARAVINWSRCSLYLLNPSLPNTLSNPTVALNVTVASFIIVNISDNFGL